MRNPLAVIIRKDGLKLCHPTDGSLSEFVPIKDDGDDERMVEIIGKIKSHGTAVHLFAAEDLLFFKVLELPLDTADLSEAVGYQLEMLIPFADNEPVWHSFASVREDDAYRVILYAVQAGKIDNFIRSLIDAGIQPSGLYPESQRFVVKVNRKKRWGLLLPGRFFKLCVFNGPLMDDRLLCSQEPSFAEAVEVCATDMIFKIGPEQQDETSSQKNIAAGKSGDDFLDAGMLLSNRPLLKKYNMLPSSYRRTDYFKLIVTLLLILNAVAFCSFVGVKAYNLKSCTDRIDQQIAAIMPLVHEIKELRRQEEHLLSQNRFDGRAKNFDLISFLSRLTSAMPPTSYVDQIRMDKNSNSIHVQGYTEDVGALTSKLQEIGETRLSSTSRRRNKIYFHVEISAP